MSQAAIRPEEPLVLVGEVHTALLQHSAALSPTDCRRLLDQARGAMVRSHERPISHTVSAPRLTGVDCQLASTAGPTPRGVGSVAVRTAITGGHVLQGYTVGRLVRGTAGRRLPWSHYLARPGRIEVIGKADPTALAEGFLTDPRQPSTLDLAAPSARLVDAVQAAPTLDRAPPFRAARTRLRWAVLVTPEPAGDDLRFTVERQQLRTVLLRCDPGQAAGIVDFCVDLALHDWLLSTLLGLVERSRIGAQPRPAVVRRLGPAVDHLLHLWMPAARTDAGSTALWESLERRPGLSRQWQVTVDRIRDQLALSTISLLTAGHQGSSG